MQRREWRRRRECGEDEGGLSHSAYLTTEHCTCCGCQAVRRFTSSVSCHGGVSFKQWR